MLDDLSPLSQPDYTEGDAKLGQVVQLQVDPALDCVTVNGRTLMLDLSGEGYRISAWADYALMIELDINGRRYQLSTDEFAPGPNPVVSLTDITNAALPETLIALDIPVSHPAMAFFKLKKTAPRQAQIARDQANDSDQTPQDSDHWELKVSK